MKNLNMLKTFFKVMQGNKKYIDLVTPNIYINSVYDIDYKLLKKNKINYIIFDIDNTILPVNDINVPEELINLINKIKKDFDICLVSNNNVNRVKPVGEILDVKYLYEAKKPTKQAFDNTLKLLKSNKKNTVMVGDQMLSDIKGANEYGLYTILVKPLKNKYDIKTGTSRVLQKIIENKLNK